MSSSANFCEPHKAEGWLRQGITRLNGKLLCVDCLAGKPVQRKVAAPIDEKTAIVVKEEEVKRKKVDWDSLDRDAQAGVAPKELAKKYDVTVQSVYCHKSLTKKRGRVMSAKKDEIPKTSARAVKGSLLEQARMELATVEAWAMKLRSIVDLLEEV
jgi:hypothetical protein